MILKKPQSCSQRNVVMAACINGLLFVLVHAGSSHTAENHGRGGSDEEEEAEETTGVKGFHRGRLAAVWTRFRPSFSALEVEHIHTLWALPGGGVVVIDAFQANTTVHLAT